MCSSDLAAGEAPIALADGRSLTRGLRVAGKLEPIFTDAIEAMPQAIIDNALGGDVVLCMGAGTIGSVPQKVADMLQINEQHIQIGRAL